MPVASPDFTHLHCHTEYSLLDGLARVGPLMDAAQKHGMTSLALTDHGVMFGAIEFYQEAQKRGIKPILGCEVYVAPRGMEQREGKQDASGYHFVLLAENETGYRNLLTLTSEAQLRGFYYKPRVDKELLSRHSDGLIALSACLSSEVARHLLRDELDAAEKAAKWYAEVFEGRFYLELQDHGLGEQQTVNKHIAAMATRLGLPLVVTNDVHYINREHAYAQEVLLCIQTGTTVDDPKRMKMDSQEFYLKSAQEMWDRFGDYPQALKNTMEIAERCNLSLEFGRVQLPEMPVPAGHTVDTYLAAVCHRRLAERYDEVTPEVRARLDYELSVIKKTGFSAYFLLLDDIIGHAREEGIMVGPGRGSAVGSLASYCLGITDVDPLPLDLLFERFLNPDRLSMPDIDTDFSDDRRDEVIRYITERFGADKVAQISTFGTMAARAAVKDVGRALGIPYGDVERVAKLIPPKSDLKGALEVAEMRELYETTEYVRKLIDTAQQLEDVKRHNSTHAAGVVISAEPLVHVTPLVRVGKEGEEGQAAQFEAPILDKIGLLKMDILGLTTLTLIQRTIQNIEKTTGHVIHPDEIPLDDPCIYTLLTSAETAGIFQLESGGMRKVLRDMKPDRFTDIVAAVALYRPGPMAFIDQYNRRKNGQDKITYLHPDLEPILSDSYGVLVYQDQVLKIALQFAGMTWGDVDKLRKAMGKKLAEEMKKQQAAFEEGFAKTTQWQYQQDENGAPVARQVPKPSYPVELAREIWPIIETFAGYGFNKAHAAAYAQLACQTAYLKAKYAVQYMAACLSIETGAPDRMAVVLGECRRLGIAIRPPDVNHSEMDFAVEGDGIRYALQAVKNVGANAIRSIVAAREAGGSFRDLDDFCRRVEWKSLNKRALESLIKAGALDSLRSNNPMEDRALLLGNLDRICSQAQRAERAAQSGQVSLFAAVADAQDFEVPALSLAPVQEVEHKQLLAWEKEMLGIYVSPHPLSAFQAQGRRLGALSIGALGPERVGQRVKVGAQIASLRQIITRKNETMLVMELEDLEGSIEAVAFPRTYSRFRELWVEDAILLVDGTMDLRNERLQLIVEDASVFEHKVSTGAGQLRLYVPRTGDDDGDRRRCVDLYLLLREFPGEDRFELQTDEDGQRISIAVPDDTVCCCPELLQRLRDAFPGVEAEEIAAPNDVALPDLDDAPAPMLAAVEYEDDPFAEAGDFDLVPVG